MIVKEHMILGVDEADVEKQKDLWLAENPSIKVLKVHDRKREPRNLLSRLGGPRFSITVDYVPPPPSALTAEESHAEQCADEGSSPEQGPCANFFAGEAATNVSKMAHRSGGQHRCDDKCDSLPNPKADDRIHPE